MSQTINITPERAEQKTHKIWFVNAPYSGHLLFRGEPTSLLYAISPTVDSIWKGQIGGVKIDEIALLNPKYPHYYNSEELKQLLEGQPLRVVAISTTTSSSVEARRIASLVKDHKRDVIVIFGGPHEDDLPLEQKSSHIEEFQNLVDISVAGDGEFVLLAIIKSIFDAGLSSPAAVKQHISAERSYFEGCKGVGSIHFNLGNVKSVIQFNSPFSLDEVPGIPRVLLNEEDAKCFDLFMRRGRSVKTAQVLTERGCPWNCSFCSESTKAGKSSSQVSLGPFGTSIRTRSIESVVNEIEIALGFQKIEKDTYGVLRTDYKAVFFDDSTFTHAFGTRRTYVTKLLKELKRLKLQHEFEWGCQTRIDQLDEKILNDMIDAGCTYIYIGLESISDELLKQMAKGMSKIQIVESFDRLGKVIGDRGNTLRIGISLVFGAPELRSQETRETTATIDETLDFVKTLYDKGLVALLSPNVAVYYPSTLMTKTSGRDFDFHYREGIPNANYPWSRFEEGMGYHVQNFTPELADHAIQRLNKELGEIVADQDIYNIADISRNFWHSDGQAGVTYLNHASIMKPPKSVEVFAKSVSPTDNVHFIERTRDRISQLFFCKDNRQIAFGRNTSEACSLALWLSRCINPEASKVVLADIENYSIRKTVRAFADHANIGGRYRWASYPTMGREYYKLPNSGSHGRGLQSILVPTKGDPDQLEKTLLESSQSEIPDILIVSHVERTTGRISKVRDLVQSLRQINSDLIVIVDGAKAFGAINSIDPEDLGADFYLGGPHFTIGSYPVGILYLSDGTLSQLETRAVVPPDAANIQVLRGMFSPELHVDNSDENFNLPDIASLQGAIDFLEANGYMVRNSFKPLNDRRGVLKQNFISQLTDAVDNARILSPADEEHINFICSFTIQNTDLLNMVFELWVKHHVFVSYVARNNLVRVSFNYTNSESDNNTLVASIKKTLERFRGA